jgi:hypothetical protein
LSLLSYNWKPDDINSVEKYWGQPCPRNRIYIYIYIHQRIKYLSATERETSESSHVRSLCALGHHGCGIGTVTTPGLSSIIFCLLSLSERNRYKML